MRHGDEDGEPSESVGGSLGSGFIDPHLINAVVVCCRSKVPTFNSMRSLSAAD
jgi:hypothetical protein